MILGDNMKVKITDLDSFGRGITKIDNKVCFVEDTLPNEVVEIEVTKEKKKYSEAIVIKYLEKSKERRNLCPYQDTCGGCDIIHLTEKLQQSFKEEKVNHAMKYDKKIELVTSKDEFFYRNKVIFHVENNELGFYEKKSSRLVPIDQCLLVNNKINELIPILKELVKQNPITEIMVRVGNVTNELMVTIKENIKDYSKLITYTKVLFINNKLITKDNTITSYIGDKKYLVSKDSFFQINPSITKELYDYIREHIRTINSKHVLDLYCGTGTIGIYISDLVNRIIGVEIVKSAVEDAKVNKELNSVKNIEFLCGDVSDFTNIIENKVDTIIVDPPRSGLDKKIRNKLLDMNIKNIIYVSCDLYTLKRDLDLLKQNYHIEEIKAFDMFPNTHHVETVIVLKYNEKE